MKLGKHGKKRNEKFDIDLLKAGHPRGERDGGHLGEVRKKERCPAHGFQIGAGGSAMAS